jgi:hypothetical protein
MSYDHLDTWAREVLSVGLPCTLASPGPGKSKLTALSSLYRNRQAVVSGLCLSREGQATSGHRHSPANTGFSVHNHRYRCEGKTAKPAGLDLL